MWGGGGGEVRDPEDRPCADICLSVALESRIRESQGKYVLEERIKRVGERHDFLIQKSSLSAKPDKHKQTYRAEMSEPSGWRQKHQML